MGFFIYKAVNFKIKNIFSLQKAFSLIELLVVVAIIGILAGIAIFGYNAYVANALMNANIANARLLANKLNAERLSASTCTGSNAINTLTLSNTNSIWTLDVYINCVNSILSSNNFINPYTRQPYGSQNSGNYYAAYTPGPNVIQWAGSWFGGTYPTPSSPATFGSGSCTDDVAGLMIIQDNAQNNKWYMSTCSNNDPNFGQAVYSAFLLN